MSLHELKTWPGPFRDILDGRKSYEIREDNRGFEVGDQLVLREFIPGEKRYTERNLLVSVVHITRGGQFYIPKGICIMGIAPCLDEPTHGVKPAPRCG